MAEIIFTFLPPILIVFYIIYTDKLKEPISLIISTFCLGCLLILPAGLLNNILIGDNDNYSFIAGFTEETLKFLALFFYIKDRKEFDEPMDAIVYGCLISLGFATYENYEYVFLYDFEISSLSVAIIRSISAIPLHACCGIIMGYFFIYYHFEKRKIFLFYSLIIPISIHAVYNYLADSDETYFNLYLISVIIFTVYLHKKIRIQQKNQSI